MLTIITPATSRDLTVLDTVKNRLGITDTAHDATLSALISAYSGVAEDYCNRVFAQETVEETLRLPRNPGPGLRRGRYEIVLTRYPATAIVSATDGDTTLDATGYELDQDAGVLYRLDGDDNQLRWTGPKIVVRYTAGYALLDSLPYGIEEGVIELVKAAYLARDRDPLLRSAGDGGLGSRTYWVGAVPGSGPLPPNVTALFDPHRRFAVA